MGCEREGNIMMFIEELKRILTTLQAIKDSEILDADFEEHVELDTAIRLNSTCIHTMQNLDYEAQHEVEEALEWAEAEQADDRANGYGGDYHRNDAGEWSCG